MRLQTALRLGDVVGIKGANPLRGASDAARKCKPRGYGWVPKVWHSQSRAEKVAVYRKRREAGMINDASWRALCGDYPELTR